MTLAVVLGVALAYVLPPDRVVVEVARVREALKPVRIEATLEGISDDWPTRVRLEAHPTRGVRITDSLGGRWLQRDGRIVAGSTLPPPAWIPDIELLFLRAETDLATGLASRGIDVGRNDLARCGAFDCFAVGGRTGGARVLFHKDRFELVALRGTDGPRTEFRAYEEFDGIRLPTEIERSDEFGTIGTLRVESADLAPDLETGDFSPAWILLPAAPPGN